MKRFYNTGLLFSLFAVLATYTNGLIEIRQPEKFNLIIGLYNETNEARMNEYLTCLEYNLNHPSIKHVHVIYDRSRDDNTNLLLNELRQKRIRISYVTSRPSFAEFFKQINTLYPDGSKIILSNADIYFNETLQLLESYNFKKKFLALTRWNIISSEGPEIALEKRKNGANNISSQDTWIFSSPVADIRAKDILLGTYQCDGRIAYQARKAHYTVYNPCLTVQCLHLHQVEEARHYAQVSPKGKRDLSPWLTLDQVPKH